MRGVVAVVALLGCGDASKPPLTCAAEDAIAQCIGQEAFALQACMPMRATTAVMSSDRTSCRWADGTSVVFDRPLPLNNNDDVIPLAFNALSADGTQCGRFSWVSNVNQALLIIDVDLPAPGAVWNDDQFDLTLSTACGSAQHSYASDIVETGCPTIIPSASSSLSSTRLALTLTTSTTFGMLFACE